MSTLATIQATDQITSSRTDINDNFTALNTDKIETSVLDTDTALAADSDLKVATQKAVKGYVDAIAPTLVFAGVRAIQNATTSTSSTYATLAFQTEDFDTDSFHNNSTNNSRLTVPTGKAGYYNIGGAMKITTTSAKATYVRIRLNGTTVLATQTGAGGVDSVNSSAISTLYYLSEGDYVELQGASASVDTSTGDAKTSFWMYRVG